LVSTQEVLLDALHAAFHGKEKRINETATRGSRDDSGDPTTHLRELSARAEKHFGPPPSGCFGVILQPMVQCDNEQQVVDIAAVGQEDDKPMLARFGELFRTQNSKGERTCVFGRLSVAVQVGEVTSPSDVVLSGAHKKAWALHRPR
jgi:hypothetical protein